MFGSPPSDLSTRPGRKAWRHDMRMVAVRPRRWGLWLMTLGFLLMVMPSAMGVHALFGWSPSLVGIALIAAALPLLLVSVVLKRRDRTGRAGLQKGDKLR